MKLSILLLIGGSSAIQLQPPSSQMVQFPEDIPYDSELGTVVKIDQKDLALKVSNLQPMEVQGTNTTQTSNSTEQTQVNADNVEAQQVPVASNITTQSQQNLVQQPPAAPAQVAQVQEQQKPAVVVQEQKAVPVAQAVQEVKAAPVAQEAAPFKGYVPVRKTLANISEGNLVESLIIRHDGLNHLLLTDVNNLLMSIQHDFKDITRVYSIGKSFEHRDINVIEIDTTMSKEKPKSMAQQDSVPAWEESLVQLNQKDAAPSKHAILMTGSTHAREMISTSMNIFEILQLLQKGVVKPDPTWVSLLNQNKYIYMPIFNVDGVALIEDAWTKNKKIPGDRKNQDNQYDPFGCVHTSDDGGLVDIGVDLNRNFGVDFGQMDKEKLEKEDKYFEKQIDRQSTTQPCSTNYPGPAAFSEPETQAFRSFLQSKQNELAFVINVHSNGNAFIYPFNGRAENDIEKRRPGVLAIFQQIADKASFPYGEMKGTSHEVMGEVVSGDQDDWTLAELGIPSVTAELGYVGEFIDDWQVRTPGTAQDMLTEQSKWVNYIYQNLPQFGQVVDSHRK